MSHNSIVKLDPDYNRRFSKKIYNVDGLHGTLKELSDYFEVDPISVSDLILNGESLSDALCLASKSEIPIVNPKNLFDLYMQGNLSVKDIAKKYNMSPANVSRQLRSFAYATDKLDAYKRVISAHRSHAGRKISGKIPVNKVTDKVKNSIEFVSDESVTTEINMLPAIKSKQIISTKAISNVQDLGDRLIVTTTTTVIYKK